MRATKRTNPAASGKTSPLVVFQQDLYRFRMSLRTRFENLVNWVFAYTHRGAQRRMSFFLAVTLVLWLALAYIAHPVAPSSSDLVQQWISALIALDVLRHLLVMSLALWVGQRAAAVYLDDIFELGDIGISGRFISEAAFFGGNSHLVVRGGEVPPEYKDSPIIRIGGPGGVDVHLENAALFEKIDGSPHVIGPTHQHWNPLEGFERLRTVIDLRDQVITVDVKERTRDGILVEAKDIRLLYSVDRGPKKPAGSQAFEQPYPFAEQAIIKLVYAQGRDHLVNAMKSTIRTDLREFISQHKLGDFLANAEITKTPGVSSFVPRDKIAAELSEAIGKHAANKGVQLTWVGIGTWETSSQIIPERHLEAWKLSSEARIQSSPEILQKVHREAGLSELLRLVDLIPIEFNNLREQDLPDERIVRELVKEYREKIREARQIYLDNSQPVPKDLEDVYQFLAKTWL